MILLDGVDTTTMSPAWLRTAITLVDQDPVLFSGTIAENIRFARQNATTEQIEQAAREANAHDFITAFPQGEPSCVVVVALSS